MAARGRVPSIAIAFALSASIVFLSACSGSVSVGSDPKMNKDEAEKQTRAALAKQYGSVPPVTCPGDLNGAKGSTMTCVIGPDQSGKSYDVLLTSNGVNGDMVDFNIKVGGVTQGN